MVLNYLKKLFFKFLSLIGFVLSFVALKNINLIEKFFAIYTPISL